jgi:preprotein translocase subunit SecF
MLRGIQIVPANTNVPFIASRNVFFTFSILMVLGAIALLLVRGLNFGIDFKGGILIEVRTAQAANVSGMRSALSGLDLGDVELQEFGDQHEVLVRLPMQEGGEAAQQAALEKVRGALGPGIEYRRTEIVGPKVSDELLWDGIAAVALALAGILVYVWFRFEWQFGLCGVAALLHDVITTLGMFAFLGWEFNLTTVAAVLTIAGYSINDTVVIYDRVRENLRKYKALSLPELLNKSLNETLARTAMTSGTTLVAVLALFIFGGEVIRGFSAALIWGITIGTYSSVAVATPLLLYMNLSRVTAKRKEEAAA